MQALILWLRVNYVIRLGLNGLTGLLAEKSKLAGVYAAGGGVCHDVGLFRYTPLFV